MKDFLQKYTPDPNQNVILDASVSASSHRKQISNMSLGQEEIIPLQFLFIYFKFKMGGFFFLLFFCFLSCLLAVDCLIFQLHSAIQMCISNIIKLSILYTAEIINIEGKNKVKH